MDRTAARLSHSNANAKLNCVCSCYVDICTLLWSVHSDKIHCQKHPLITNYCGHNMPVTLPSVKYLYKFSRLNVRGIRESKVNILQAYTLTSPFSYLVSVMLALTCSWLKIITIGVANQVLFLHGIPVTTKVLVKTLCLLVI